jgi:predicted Na+-dependent transporter
LIVAHALTQLLATYVEAANFLQIVRDAVFGFLAVVLLIGLLIGFFIGRAFGRRR